MLNHLLNNGQKVVRPVLSLKGNYVEAVEIDKVLYNVVSFKGLKGNIYDTEDLNDQQIYEWGKSLATLHNAMKDLPQFNRPTYLDILNSIIPVDEAMEKELKSVIKECSELRVNKDNFGMIHYDYESDNLVFSDSIYSLDFDDCCYSWYVADIYYALRDFLAQDKLVLNEKTNLFLNGYRSVKAIDEELLHNDIWMRIHNLYMYHRLKRAVDIIVSDENPDWMNNIINKLNRGLLELEEGFNQ